MSNCNYSYESLAKACGKGVMEPWSRGILEKNAFPPTGKITGQFRKSTVVRRHLTGN